MKTAECNYGISQADMYQMYAYAHRYSSGNNILLFPWSEGLKTQTYCLGDGREKCIHVGFINLNRELRLSENKDYLRAELFKIIHGTSANQTSEVSKISEVYG